MLIDMRHSTHHLTAPTLFETHSARAVPSVLRRGCRAWICGLQHHQEAICGQDAEIEPIGTDSQGRSLSGSGETREVLELQREREPASSGSSGGSEDMSTREEDLHQSNLYTVRKSAILVLSQ